VLFAAQRFAQRRGGFDPEHPLQDTIIEKIAPIPLGR